MKSKTIIINNLFIIIFLGIHSNLFSQNVLGKVTLGSDLICSENFELIAGKTVGIITNHTGRLSKGVHLVDTLNSLENVTIKALFGPEHGIRGDAPDGKSIKTGIDPKTGIPVYSLYGQYREPTDEMLRDIDVLLFMIQDIGSRYYTYISTLYYSLNSAAKHKIPIIVLDTPNPINGVNVDGPIRTEEYKSFVGIAPIPIVHGMTMGELAEMFNEENWLECGEKADLTVIKMKNWRRNMYFDETGLNWINPSPNMVNIEAAILYPGLCLLEGTNISEGRGTKLPFIQIGAPYINSAEIIEELNDRAVPGIEYLPVEFTPRSIQGMSTNPKYKDAACFGITLNISERSIFPSIRFGVEFISSVIKLYPEEFKFRGERIDRLFGNSYLREMLLAGKSWDEIHDKFYEELSLFKQLRSKYLLY